MNRSEPAALWVLGERVTPLTIAGWLDEVAAAVDARARRAFVSLNLHGAYLIKRDRELRALHERAWVVRVDGMPLVWIGRWAGRRIARAERAGFMDLMHPLMARAAERGWRVFVLAGKPGVAEAAARVLRDRHAGLILATDDGYFDVAPDSAQAAERVARVHAFAPDLVVVGLGMPRQERFLLHHLEALPSVPALTCGAAFDYVAGAIPMCPRWMSALGLEWAFRLAAEPRRLAFRYLVEPLTLLPDVARDVLGRRGHPGRR